MAAVGLEGRENHTPGEFQVGSSNAWPLPAPLSAIPMCLLADEPTGNLDSARSHDIMKLLQGLNRDTGLTILMVTHEPDMAEYCSPPYCVF